MGATVCPECGALRSCLGLHLSDLQLTLDLIQTSPFSQKFPSELISFVTGMPIKYDWFLCGAEGCAQGLTFSPSDTVF